MSNRWRVFDSVRLAFIASAFGHAIADHKWLLAAVFGFGVLCGIFMHYGYTKGWHYEDHH